MRKNKKLITTIVLAVFGCMCLIFAGCKKDNKKPDDGRTEGMFLVTYDVCTDLEVRKVNPREVYPDAILTKPNVVVTGANPTHLEIVGWYLDKEYTDEWWFESDTVTKDITLYAKWESFCYVNYYLTDETNSVWGNKPIVTDRISYGEPATERNDLYEGYEFFGFYTERECENEYDFDAPVMNDLDLYMKTSTTLYFDAKSIENRFVGVPANNGNNGSTFGYIKKVGEGKNSYAEIDYGNSISVADPYIVCQNPSFDMRATQLVKVTFKNLGNATHLALYWASKTANGQFSAAQSFTSECHVTYKYDSSMINMKETDDWQTIIIDLAGASVENGVSYWGNSTVLTQLRIQSNPNLSICGDNNKLQIKSIKGISVEELTAEDKPLLDKMLNAYSYSSDYKTTLNKLYTNKDEFVDLYKSKFVSTADTFAEGFLENDSEADVNNAGENQTAINGFIFPKDKSVVGEVGSTQTSTSANCEIYDKTEGMLLHSGYKQKNVNLFLDATGKNIDLDTNTTVKFKLQNYGYIQTLNLNFATTDGFMISATLSVDKLMKGVSEFVLNMYEARDYSGVLDFMTITFDSVGINNAILIESIEFCGFTSKPIVGFNLNDSYKCFGFENNDDVTVSFDKAKATGESATKFEINKNGARIEKVIDYDFAVSGYKVIEFAYRSVTGVSNVKLCITTENNGVQKETAFVYELDPTVKKVTIISKAFEDLGYVKKIAFVFDLAETVKSGSVSINRVGFGLERIEDYHGYKNMPFGVDFSNGSYFNAMDTVNWVHGAIYDEQNLAVYQEKGKSLDCYVGGATRNTGLGNLDMNGKTKIVVIYQNTTSENKLQIGFGVCPQTDENWVEAGGYYPSQTGKYHEYEIKSNMADNEWAVLEIDIETLGNDGEYATDGYALALVEFSFRTSMKVRCVTMY